MEDSDAALKAAVVSAVLSGFCAPNVSVEDSATLQHRECESACSYGRRLHLSWFSRGFTFVLVIMGAAEERYLVEHVLLEPFDPEINHWRDE
jgi:hypothetical protein